MEKLKGFERDGAGNLTYAPFKANGVTYRFIKPGDGIGIRKWQEYEKLKIVAGVGRTFHEIVNVLKEHMTLLGADRDFAEIRTEAILQVDSLRKSILDLSRERYSKFLYLASIFIYPEGTDPYAWDYDAAETMIENWEKEGINEQDLLFFSLSLIPAWSQTFKELQEKANKEGERLSGLTGLTAKK